MINSIFFKGFIIILILSSTIALVFDDYWIDTRPKMKDALYYLEIVFAACFLAEMLLRLHAMGLVGYFTSGWRLLELAVLAATLASLAIGLAEDNGILDDMFRATRSLAALRALRLVWIASEVRGTREIALVVLECLPRMANLLLACMFLWLTPSIIFVNFFNGKFYKCVQTSTGRRWSHEVVPNRTACEQATDALWVNSRANFDNIFNSYVSLLMVS